MNTGEDLGNFLRQNKLLEVKLKRNKFKHIIRSTGRSHILKQIIKKEITAEEG